MEADRISLGRSRTLVRLLFDDIWKFQRLLRRLEYRVNRGSFRPIVTLTAYRLRRMGRKLGYTIPPNVFGPGLAIAHAGTIVVSSGARIGANCRIHACVNIGTRAGAKCEEAPVIGQNCYIGPGAKLFGPIVLGSDMAIGANAVVNRSFPRGPATIAGVPARVISNKGSEGLLVRGYSGERSDDDV